MRTCITSGVRESDGRSLTNGSRRSEGESRASVLRDLLAKAEALPEFHTDNPRDLLRRTWARLTGAAA
jgi:hypothetical protein